MVSVNVRSLAIVALALPLLTSTATATATATVAYFRPHLPSACFSLLLSYSAVFAVFMSPVPHAPSATWRHLSNSRSLSTTLPPTLSLAPLATKSIVKKMSSVFNLIKWESLLTDLPT